MTKINTSTYTKITGYVVTKAIKKKYKLSSIVPSAVMIAVGPPARFATLKNERVELVSVANSGSFVIHESVAQNRPVIIPMTISL